MSEIYSDKLTENLRYPPHCGAPNSYCGCTKELIKTPVASIPPRSAGPGEECRESIPTGFCATSKSSYRVSLTEYSQFMGFKGLSVGPKTVVWLTEQPTQQPTGTPSEAPTEEPSKAPTDPTEAPSVSPSQHPTELDACDTLTKKKCLLRSGRCWSLG